MIGKIYSSENEWFVMYIDEQGIENKLPLHKEQNLWFKIWGEKEKEYNLSIYENEYAKITNCSNSKN